MRPRTYQSYSSHIKKAIIETGNIHLYPELHIPKSTAYHWIKNGIRALDGEGTEGILTFNANSTTPPREDGEKGAELILILAKLLSIALQLIPSRVIEKNVDAFKQVKLLMRKINPEDLAKIVSKKLARLLSEPSCKSSYDGKCLRRWPGQLGSKELIEMQRLVTAQKYAHFSISSLCLYAKRHDILHCCRDTWYRYINRFGWERPFKMYKIPKRKTVGLRASRPNEIWHLDATQIQTTHGRIFYLQALVDNFSRLVLAWKVTSKINAKNTARLIENAFEVHRLTKPMQLISDGGSENANHTVSTLLKNHNHPRVVHRLAKHQIDKTNAMAENFFHGLKTKHLNHCSLNNRRDIVQNAGFYIQQKNEIIPLNVFHGLTAREMHLGAERVEFARELAAKCSQHRSRRLESNKVFVCGACT